MRTHDSIYSILQVLIESENISHEEVDPEDPLESRMLHVSLNAQDSESHHGMIIPESVVHPVEVDPVFSGIHNSHDQESSDPISSIGILQSSSVREIFRTTSSRSIPL